MRMRDKETQQVYEFYLTNTHRGIIVKKLQHQYASNGKILYYWMPDTTYENLTIAKIEQSIRAADQVNAESRMREQLPYPHTYSCVPNVDC